MKERIHYFDTAKGILILLLLVSHFSVAAHWAGVDKANPNFLGLYYFQPAFVCFFMQCFFIVSGYCSGFDGDFKPFCVKMVRQLLIPWLFFEVVRMTYFGVQGHGWSLFPNSELTTYWFLNALIFAKLTCYILHRIDKNDRLLLCVSFVMLLGGIALHEMGGVKNVFCFQQSLVDTFFVSVGYLLRKHQHLYAYALRYSAYLFILIIAGRFLHLYDLPVQDASIGVTLHTTPLFLITTLSGSFAFLGLCKWLNKNAFLEYFGRTSLVVYGLHMFPFTILTVCLEAIFDLDSTIQTIFFFISLYTLLLAVLWGIIEVLSTKYLRFLIGK